MTELICVLCQLKYKIVKNGNAVVEMFQQPPEPYRIRQGDRWECPGCNHQIVAGFAEVSLGEHYHFEFSNVLKRVLEDKNTIYCYEG